MSYPSLSVFVPNYNHACYLDGCLQSVMSQSVAAAEVIVLDDVSTDNSREVLLGLSARYPRLRVESNTERKGVLPNMNRGLELASGDFILFLAADDQLLPGIFEKTLPLLARHPQAAFCGGITRFREEATGLEYLYGKDVSCEACYLAPEDMIRLSRRGKLLMFATPMLVNRRQILASGGYHPELKWCSDWFAVWTAGYQTGVCYVPEVLGEFRKHDAAYSAKGMRRPGERSEIYRGMLDHLAEPACRVVSNRIREAAALALFGKEMLWLMLRHRQHRHFLTPTFLAWNFWWSLRTELKKVLPTSLSRAYFRWAGYTTPPRAGSQPPTAA